MFTALITPKSILFTTPSGKPINVSDAHPNFSEMRETLRLAQAAKREGHDDDFASHLDHLIKLSEPARQIVAASKGGRVTVRDGVVYYGDEPIHNTITERILWGLREGFDMDPYVAFLDNLMLNPSNRAVNELYGFMEANGMGITDDGCLITYKKVRDDYRDIHSGTFDNSVGQVREMVRNKVDDRSNVTCSTGFHVCSYSYLPHFGSGSGDRVVICKVHPRDVVSIPNDYQNAKMRVCRYEVIGEVPQEELSDILSQKPVWSLSDWSDTVDEDFDDTADEDSETYETGYEDGFREGQDALRQQLLSHITDEEEEDDEWRSNRYTAPY